MVGLQILDLAILVRPQVRQPMKTEDYKEYNEHLFERLVSIYDTAALVLIPIRKRIGILLKEAGSKNILDVACGTGTQAISLAEEGFQVTGIDLSTAMLKRAEMKANKIHKIRFLCEDATQMRFKDGSFDATTISFALHDMPHEIRTKVLKEMERVTKKGGHIIIADYATPSDGFVPKIEHHISNLFESKYYESFMEKGLNSYLVQAGLKPDAREILMIGIAQIVVCIKN